MSEFGMHGAVMYRPVSNEGFYAFTSAFLPFEGIDREEFRLSYERLLSGRAEVAEALADPTGSRLWEPSGVTTTHWGGHRLVQGFIGPLPENMFSPRYTVVTPYRGERPVMCQYVPPTTVTPVNVPKSTAWRWVAKDLYNRILSASMSKELVYVGPAVLTPDQRRDARVAADKRRNARLAKDTLFVTDSAGKTVPRYNGTGRTFPMDSRRKDRNQTWSRDLHTFEPMSARMFVDRSIRYDSVHYGWKWVDRTGKSVPPRVAAKLLREQPSRKFPRKARVEGKVRVPDETPWHAVTEWDSKVIGRIARDVMARRDIELKIRVARNEWEDVRQDALVKFAEFLAKSDTWTAFDTDEFGRPGFFRGERKNLDEVDAALMGDILLDGGNDTECPEDPDNPDTWGKTYYKITRVTLYYWSVKAAAKRPKVGGKGYRDPVRTYLKEQEESGHWAQTPASRPQNLTTVYKAFEPTNAVDEDLFLMTFHDGSEYPELAALLTARKDHPEASNSVIWEIAAQAVTGKDKVTRTDISRLKGNATVALRQFRIDLAEVRQEWREVLEAD